MPPIHTATPLSHCAVMLWSLIATPYLNIAGKLALVPMYTAFEISVALSLIPVVL